MWCQRCGITQLDVQGRCPRCDAGPRPGPYGGTGPQAAPGARSAVRTTDGLALTITLMNALVGVLIAVSSVSALRLGDLISRDIRGEDSLGTQETHTGLTMLGVSGVTGVLGCVAATVFLVWCHQVRANAQVFNPQVHRHSPGWAVGAWFVPVVSLWFPRQILGDVHRASDLRQPPRGQGLLTAWWALWICSGLTLGGAAVYGEATFLLIATADHVPDSRLGDLVTAVDAAAAAGFLALAALVLMTLTVRRITALQREYVSAGTAAPAFR